MPALLLRVLRVTALAFLLPLAFVWRFFFGERFYPRTPLHPVLGELPSGVDLLLFSLLVGLLLGMLFTKRPRSWIGTFLVLSLGFSLWDQSRWMPYFYQFFFMFFALYGFRWEKPDKDDEQRVVNTLAMVNLPIWLWSGLHKISLAYIYVGYPWMMAPFLSYLPAELHGLLYASAFLSPIVEAGGALLLLFPRTRKPGVLLLTAMHLVILLIFGPLGLGWNPSVWSWNVAMIVFLWLLFFRLDATPRQLLLGTGRNRGDRFFHRLIVVLFLVMPIFNRFGYWDDFLSHCLYSWTTREAEIVVPAGAAAKLPEEVRRNIRHDLSEPILPVLNWSFDLFNSPPYHSYRVFHTIFRKFCETTGGDESLEFRIFEKPAMSETRGERISYRCAGAGEIRETARAR